jgi:hypothetical protein
LAKETKPFFFPVGNSQKYLQHTVKEFCPEKETAFNTISLSRTTMKKRVENISNNLFNELRNKAK